MIVSVCLSISACVFVCVYVDLFIQAGAGGKKEWTFSYMQEPTSMSFSCEHSFGAMAKS
jgi:hypothetical protein